MMERLEKTQNVEHVRKYYKKCLCCDICDKLICCTCLNVNNKLFNVLIEAKINYTALLVACQKCRTSAFKVIKNEINQKSTMLENNNKN